jgi:uncharacterized protein (TIGR00369 family)
MMKANAIEQFGKQGLMNLLNAQIRSIEEGKVVIECPYSEIVSQQHGFFHAGVMTSIVDTACGFAAFTLMPEGYEVLSVEFKMNLLKPAKSDAIVAVGQVLQAGKTLTVCEGFVYDATMQKLFAKMTATMITVPSSKFL